MNILITGAGGAAAISFLKAAGESGDEFWMADMDRYAAGLYLVGRDRRLLLPRGDAPVFVDTLLALCREREIDLVVPTVDAELMPLARAIRRFLDAGIRLLLSDEAALARTLDKYALLETCKNGMQLARYALLDSDFDDSDWRYPFLVKPRTGAGSRGVVRIDSSEMLTTIPRDGLKLVQEYLPGEEYSVDCFVTFTGELLAAVPRLRLKTDSGIAVAGRTLHDDSLVEQSRRALSLTGNRYLANVQFRRDAEGNARLLEINPRASGALPLTVEAGVNTPRMALQHVEGNLEPGYREFRDIAVVRFWEERYIPVEAFDELPGKHWRGRPTSKSSTIPWPV